MTLRHTHTMSRALPALLFAAGAATAAVAVGGANALAQGATMPQLAVETYGTQVFWLAVVFAIFFIIIWKAVLPRVGSVIEMREQKIAGDLKHAAKLRDEVTRIDATIAESLSEARAQAQEILRTTQTKIKDGEAAEQAKLERAVAARMGEAEERINAAREAAIGNIASMAESVTAGLVEKLTGDAVDDETVKNAVAPRVKGKNGN